MFCTSFVLLYTAVFSQMQNHVSSAKGLLFPSDVSEDQRFKHRNTSSFSLWNMFLFFAVALHQNFHLLSLCSVQVNLNSRVCNAVISTQKHRDESFLHVGSEHLTKQQKQGCLRQPSFHGGDGSRRLVPSFPTENQEFPEYYMTMVTFKFL